MESHCASLGDRSGLGRRSVRRTGDCTATACAATHCACFRACCGYQSRCVCYQRATEVDESGHCAAIERARAERRRRACDCEEPAAARHLPQLRSLRQCASRMNCFLVSVATPVQIIRKMSVQWVVDRRPQPLVSILYRTGMEKWLPSRTSSSTHGFNAVL
jgi:hypothetical protein